MLPGFLVLDVDIISPGFLILLVNIHAIEPG